MYYAKEIVNEIKASRQLIIFGAGVVAQNVIYCLTQKPYELHIDYCLVSDKQNNPQQLLGVSVIDFNEAETCISKDAIVLVASLDKNVEVIEQLLQENGYHHTIPLAYEADLWTQLRANYYREYRISQGKSYLTLEQETEKYLTDSSEKKVTIYTAKCHVDKVLQEDISRYTWETPIQVGAALTEDCICQVRDNIGENISNKNKQYCELTALYWIWKNDKSDYAGLCHYRRHFEVTEEQLCQLSISDIDVVLTVPILDYPSVEEVYRRDHVGKDWDIMMTAIKELAPEYLDTAHKLAAGKFYHAYNMFIMKKEILDDYCEWLFDILFYCEQHCENKTETYQNRYIGFLAEHLMAIYFMHHENEFKIVHANKHFIEK